MDQVLGEILQQKAFIKISAFAVTGALAAYVTKRVHDALSYYPFPGPRDRGILGTKVPKLHPDSIESIFLQHTDAHFSPVSTRFHGLLVVFLGSAADITEHFKNRPSGLIRSPIFPAVFDSKPGNPGLFTAEGDEWRRQRRAYAPAFNAHNVNQMLPLICKKAEMLTRKIEKLGTVHEMVDLLKLCMTDIICEAALGVSMNYLEREDLDGDDEFVRLFKLLQLRFVDSSRKMIRDLKIQMIAIWFPRWISRWWVAIRECFERGEQINAIVEKLLTRKLLEIRTDPSKAKERCLMDQAILQMLRSDTDDAWTRENMLNNLISNFSTFFIAGSETTANSLAWLLYFLCCHPEWERRCRDEVQQMLGGRPVAALQPGDLRGLPTLRACMYEAMRIDPTVAVMGSRVKAQGYTIRGRSVPEGAVVVNLKRIATTVASGLEDPTAFRPERWLDEAGSLRKEHEVGSGVLVFGGGPRECPGRLLAETEVLVIASAALSSFAEIRMLQRPDEVKRGDLLTLAPAPFSLTFEKMPARQRSR